MKLLYCIKSLHNPGGMERILTIKANWLSANGHEVHVVTARQKGRKAFFDLDPRVDLVDLGDKSRFKGRYKGNLVQAISEIGPDICISLGGKDATVLPEAAQGRPCLVEYHFCHDKFFIKYPGLLLKPYAWLRTRRRDKAFAKFDCLVVLTKADIQVWSSIVRDVRQVYNPITASPEAGQVANDLDAKRLVAVGRLEKQKNFRDLVIAWQAVSSRHPDWKLDIFGNGSQEGKLLGLISKLGLEGKVNLCGLSNRIASEYPKSSGIVLSSIHEGFPLVLVEGSSFGLPLISYDCPTGPSEIIEDGVNGLLVKTGDTGQLAESICRVIEDVELRKRMGAAALRTSRRFSLPAIMGQWEDLFSELSTK